MKNQSCHGFTGNGEYVWNSGFTEPRNWLAGTQWAGSPEYEYTWSAYNAAGYVAFEQENADGGWHCYEFENSDFESSAGANQFINAMYN